MGGRVKDNYGHWYEPNHVFSKKPEVVEEIKKFSMTKEEVIDIFDYTKWWFPLGPDYKSFSGYHRSSFDENEEWPFYTNSNTSPLVIFDTHPDLPDTQIVRILHHFWKRREKENRYHKYRLDEAGRYYINTRTGEIRSVDFAAHDYHPTEDWRMLPDDKDIYYDTGGYYGSVGLNAVPELAFYFRSMAPRTKPLEVIQRILKEMVEVGGYYKDRPNVLNVHKWIAREAQMDVFIQNSPFEELWDKFPFLREKLYSGYSSWSPYSNIKKNWPYLKVALRHGLGNIIKSSEDFSEYLDFLKLLPEGRRKNPKYTAAPNFLVLHQELIDKHNRKTQRELERKERQRRLEAQVAIERQTILLEEELKEKTEKYKELHGKHLEISWKSDKYQATVLQDVQEFLRLGLEFGNCVYSAGYYEKDTSVILKVQKIKTREVKALIELDINSGSILQCYGPRNSSVPQDIKKFVYNDRTKTQGDNN